MELIRQPISIIGEVTVTQSYGKSMIKQNVFHNTITNRLARGLTYMITERFFGSGSGENINDYIPQYIGLGASNEGDNDFNLSPNTLKDEYKGNGTTIDRFKINSKIPDLAGGAVNYASATLRTFIAPGDMKDGYIIRELGLFTTDGTNPATANTMLARVRIDNADQITKLPGTAIDIVWNIIVAPSTDIYSVN